MSSAMPSRTILFDFDGTLADTENIHVAAWQRTLDVLGWTESDETCVRAAEVDDRQFLREIFARHNIVDGDVDGWVRRKQRLTLRLLRDSPRLHPGVASLMKTIRNRARLAVVSTSPRANIEAVLDAHDLRTAFEVVIARDDVVLSKPDPESYRLALTRLGVDSASAVAVEDSPTGVAAAQGAGVAVVAVGHRSPAGDWSSNAKFLPDLRDLTRTLAVLGVSV